MSITPQEALQRTVEHREIFHDEMLHLMRLIMRGELSPVMTAAIVTGLRVKKETIGEITAAAQVMREFSTKVVVQDARHLVDIVGTGGDGANTFNISTCAMFVAAAAGARTAKHGGRSVSSKSGSADVMEALGVRTIFNILGPLTNPAGAPNILMGVFHADLVGIQVRVLQRLGAQHAIVVYGRDNMDEVSLGASTLVGELVNGEIREYEIHPEDFGMSMIASRNLKVADSIESKAKMLEALRGEPGAAADIVALNAGTALYAAGVASSIEDGLARARIAVSSGAALAKLEQFVQVTQQLGTPKQA